MRLEFGKLDIVEGFPQIRFSISHSDLLVGVAVSSCFDVGFDIESVDTPISAAVKESFFTCEERRRLAGLGAMHGLRGAMRIWTLKEAFSKLSGRGLANEFQKMDFRIFPQTELIYEQHDCEPAHFELLYIDGHNSLSLATLAVAPLSSSLGGEIQFLNLVEDGASDPDLPSPWPL